jgi:hypothetical protein
MSDASTKVCSKCKKELLRACFNKNKSTKDGLSYSCKECKAASDKQWYENNSDHVAKYNKTRKEERAIANKRWTSTHKEQRAATWARWYEENREHVEEYRNAHKEQKSATNKTWADSHKEQRAETNKQWYKNNKDHRTEWVKANRKAINAYFREKRASDPNFKIACNIRKRISTAASGKFKAGSGVRDCGCSVVFISEYLESLFWPNMSWKNYGKEWAIDHIIPLVNFDLQNREQFLKACHYSNLQPLRKDDNVIKNDRLDWEPSESRHELPERLIKGPSSEG